MTDRIIGPSGGRRRRRSLALLSLAGLLALALTLWFAIGAGAVGNESGFEDDDGNLEWPNDPSIEGKDFDLDWNSFAPTTWGNGTAPYRETSAYNTEDEAAGWTFKGIEDAQKPANRNDTQFAGGTKQDHFCPTVNATGNVLNKDDLKRIYLSTKTVDGDVFLNLAWVRITQNTTSASAHVAFEFNKGETACPGEPPSSNLVERTAGDMLVVYDFEGGTDTPSIKLARWTTTPGDACDVASNSPPCWGTAIDLTELGFAEAAVNVGQSVDDDLTPPEPPDTESVTEPLGDSEFGEAGINLTAAGVFGADDCEGFGTAFGVSRSSGNSGQAQMKDLVGPADFTIANCGTAKVIKEDDAGNRINGVKFELFEDVGVLGTFEDGIDNVAANKVGECTTAGTDNGDPLGECSIDDVPIGTYWFVEDVTTLPEGYDPADPIYQLVEITAVGQTVTVTFENPRQHKVIVLVCHEGTNTLAASDVINGTSTGTSLAQGATLPEGVSEAELCGLGGASFGGLPHGNKGLTVDVGSDAHPPPSP
jgi:Prealbumin-like fold domain